MPPKPLETGDPRTLGRFELLARLGEGGQGIVYLGRGTGPGEERVAVKVLRSSVDASVLQRLARELDPIHKVQPFVTARVIEASAEGERRYIISEFIDGPSLQERVDTRGPLPEGDLQRLAAGTATALTAIHGAGVVHRDFKPANVLLGPDGPRVVGEHSAGRERRPSRPHRPDGAGWPGQPHRLGPRTGRIHGLGIRAWLAALSRHPAEAVPAGTVPRRGRCRGGGRPHRGRRPAAHPGIPGLPWHGR